MSLLRESTLALVREKQMTSPHLGAMLRANLEITQCHLTRCLNGHHVFAMPEKANIKNSARQTIAMILKRIGNTHLEASQ
jgi:hypothetical protein